MSYSQIKGFGRSVKGSQRMMRMLGIQVAWSAGVPSVTGDGFTDLASNGLAATGVIDNGQGDVTLVFKEAFGRAPTVNAMCLSTVGDAIVTIHSVSTTQVRLLVWDGTDGTSAKDNIPLHVMVYGSDTADRI